LISAVLQVSVARTVNHSPKFISQCSNAVSHTARSRLARDKMHSLTRRALPDISVVCLLNENSRIDLSMRLKIDAEEFPPAL
jgi:hypothetical protein